MKKKYVAPKSELFALQLNENIAASGGDEITGSMTIRFTQAAARCRSLYSGVEGATNIFGDEDNVWGALCLHLGTNGKFCLSRGTEVLH